MTEKEWKREREWSRKQRQTLAQVDGKHKNEGNNNNDDVKVVEHYNNDVLSATWQAA